MEDIKEVDTILENLSYLKKQISVGIQNWQKSKPDCNFYSGAIGEICRNPGKINSLIFDPLQKWLADYILNREGRIAFTGSGGLDYFLKLGLRTIYNYVIVMDFFSKNPYYLAPAPSPITQANLAQVRKAGETQKQYQEFINALSSKLIGCNEQLAFIFFKLSKTVKNLPEDLVRMQSALEQQCLSYRIRKI